jgi:hypothetical protein
MCCVAHNLESLSGPPSLLRCQARQEDAHSLFHPVAGIISISDLKVPPEFGAVFGQNQADYIINGTSVDKKAGWAKIVFMGNIHSDNAASITMTDKRTGAIVYAYAVDKKSTMHGQQTTAEACAKHLKSHMEGHE